MNQEELKKRMYPIGKFEYNKNHTIEEIREFENIILNFPGKLREFMDDLKEEDLEKRYRPGSWTIRQIIHHLADSHMNGYIRAKLTVTEDLPVIKPYLENEWSDLSEVQNTDLEYSFKILEGLHKRWGNFLKTLEPSDYERKFFHPEHKIEISLKSSTGSYAWHCDHHIEQMKTAKKNPVE
ncbi:MAG TPA: putative metal-dependent hydrolase [Ignavibacteria bacterium]|nr:putative metal-dependent hydrolase [Ignavibacteria bacterium]